MNGGFFLQAISFVGALLILIAYVGHQLKWMNSRLAYNLLNLGGSILLDYVAFHPFQIGFFVLETVWAIVSLWALLRPRHEVTRA